jgi:hypothetical protein
LKIWGWVFLGVAIGCAIVAFMFANEANEQKQRNEQLIVQNVQLTKEMRQTKADAYKDGLIACGNEDVDYLNGLADEYGGALGKLFRDMAMGWAYDDDTMRAMIESYMDEGTVY